MDLGGGNNAKTQDQNEHPAQNFTQSGDLENHSDNVARDRIFWSNFAYGDIVAFYAYMAWDHGKAVPAWNSCLLPKEMQVDIGTGEAGGNASADENDLPSSRKRRKTDALSELVANTNRFFETALRSQSSASTATSPETNRAAELSALSSQITQVENLLRNPRIPAHVAESLSTNLIKLYNTVVTMTTRQA